MAMEHVDSPSPVTRIVFLSAAAASITASSFLMCADLFTSSTGNSEATISVINLLSNDPSTGGWVALGMALLLLAPAYVGIMTAAGMWQRREKLQIIGALTFAILLILLVSTFRWIQQAQDDDNVWSVGIGIPGASISLVVMLMLWRAGIWMLDSPYRE